MIDKIKRLGAFYLFGIAMFSIGGIYVAILITVPKIAYAVLGQ